MVPFFVVNIFQSMSWLSCYVAVIKIQFSHRRKTQVFWKSHLFCTQYEDKSYIWMPFHSYKMSITAHFLGTLFASPCVMRINRANFHPFCGWMLLLQCCQLWRFFNQVIIRYGHMDLEIRVKMLIIVLVWGCFILTRIRDPFFFCFWSLVHATHQKLIYYLGHYLRQNKCWQHCN